MLVMNIMQMMSANSVSQSGQSAPNEGGFAERLDKAVAGTGTFKETKERVETADAAVKTQETVSKTEDEEVSAGQDDTREQDRYVPYAMIPIMSVNDTQAEVQAEVTLELEADIVVEIGEQPKVVISKETLSIDTQTAVAGNVNLTQGEQPAADFQSQLNTALEPAENIEITQPQQTAAQPVGETAAQPESKVVTSFNGQVETQAAVQPQAQVATQSESEINAGQLKVVSADNIQQPTEVSSTQTPIENVNTQTNAPVQIKAENTAAQGAEPSVNAVQNNITPVEVSAVQAAFTAEEAVKSANNLIKSAKENEKLDDNIIVRQMMDETVQAAKQDAVAQGYRALETARPVTVAGQSSENTGYSSEDEAAPQLKQPNAETPVIQAVQPQSIFSKEIQSITGTGEPQASPDAQGVKFQIIEQVKTMVSDAKTELTLQLKPHHLGGLSITLTSDNNGITAKLVTASKDAHMLIQSEMAAIQEVLRDKGVHVVEMEVIYDQMANTTNKGDSNNGNGSWTGQNGHTGGNQGRLQERTDNVVMMYQDISGSEVLAEHGGSVEFSA